MKASPQSWFGNLPIARKLTLLAVATSTIALVIPFIVLNVYDSSSARERLAHDTGTLARAVGANSSAALVFGDVAAARDILAGVAVNERIVSAALVTAEGKPLAVFRRASGNGGWLSSLTPSDLSSRHSWRRFEDSSFLVAEPIIHNGDHLGTLIVESDLQELRARSLSLAGMAAFSLLLAFGVAVAVASVLQRAVSMPVLALTGIARAVTRERRYDVRAVRQGGDEVGELVLAFNDMLDEIERRDADLRRHQEGLEHAVESRTKELRATIAELGVARDHAMEASRAKSEFLANVSHEVRTPLNGVIGMTDIVLDDELAPDQRERLQTIKSSAQALLGIVNDLLDFSKIESRRLDLECVPFSVRALLAQTLKLLSLPASEKRLELTVDVQADVPRAVVGDPGRLRQIIENLVGNAIKFTEQGSVSVSVTQEGWGAGRSVLHFAVADTGIGIPKEKHAAIFDPFVQADGSTTRRFGGTGLGLTICATLVRMMGGRIWLDSTPGAGSTFHVTAPFLIADEATVPELEQADAPSPVSAVRAGTTEEPGAPVLAPAAFQRRKILLAEDNVVNQHVAVGMLTPRGHVVKVVTNGAEALDALAREPFDVVLMDVQMPLMGGFEATAAIRERERTKGLHTRIVAMTAHALAGDRERCLAAGMDGYIAKPINRRELLAVVETDAAGAACEQPKIDVADALDRIGDEVLLQQMIELFLEDCPRRLASIKSAVDARDAGAIRTSAHALKGAAATVSARSLADAARAMEGLGNDGQLARVDAAWLALSTEAYAAMNALRQALPRIGVVQEPASQTT